MSVQATTAIPTITRKDGEPGITGAGEPPGDRESGMLHTPITPGRFTAPSPHRQTGPLEKRLPSCVLEIVEHPHVSEFVEP